MTDILNTFLEHWILIAIGIVLGIIFKIKFDRQDEKQSKQDEKEIAELKEQNRINGYL